MAIEHTCSGMSVFRFSAEFRFFFFLLSAFLKMIFRFFLKIAKKKGFFSFTNTATKLIDCSKNFSKQSVTFWFAVCASSVSGRCSKVPYLHSGAVSPLGTQNLTLTGTLHVGVQCLRPSLSTLITLLSLSLSHTHICTLYSFCLSLSLSHTRTHTDIQDCQLLRFRHSMLWSVLSLHAILSPKMIRLP